MLLFSLLIGSGCTQAPTTTEVVAKEKATAAFQDFGERLKTKLLAALERGGPPGAVEVCSKEAPEIARQVSQERGFEMGRSSHRLRNPANSPQSGVRDYLQKYSGAKGADAPIQAQAEGKGWVVLAPIVTQPLCLNCHGDSAQFSPELKSALEKHYPEDQAVGFKAGDLRGVFWARVP